MTKQGMVRYLPQKVAHLNRQQGKSPSGFFLVLRCLFGWPLSMNLESGVLLLCGDIRAPLKTTLLRFGWIFCPNNAF